MSQIMYAGAEPIQAPKPAFILEPMTRTRTVTICKKDENGFTMTEEDVTEDGYMVRCYRGHSVFVTSLNELKRMKLDRMVPLLNKDDEAVAVVPVQLTKKGN